MGKAKCLKVMKLSTHMPEASLEQAKEELTILRQLTAESAEFGEEMGKIIAQLRKVAAPSREPFIFTSILAENEQLLRVVFRDCGDIEFRSFYAGDHKALLIYLEGMSDTENLERNILNPLMSQAGSANVNTGNLSNLFVNMKNISERILGTATVTVLIKASEAIEAVMTGNALLLIDGLAQGLSISAVKYVKRSVGEPDTEYIGQGPNEAFNEVLTDNIVLIRRRARDINLKVRILRVGERTKTSI